MKINPGSLWKMAKNPNGNGYIVRSATAVHTSPAVAKVNAALAEAARNCKEKSRAGIRACVAQALKGKKFPR